MHVEQLLANLASLAATLRRCGPRLVEHLSALHTEGPAYPHLEDALDDATCVRELASQIGWMADLAAVKMGGTAAIGDAEQWFMPPRYHELQDTLAKQHTGVQQ